jgi:hypothetical protein
MVVGATRPKRIAPKNAGFAITFCVAPTAGIASYIMRLWQLNGVVFWAGASIDGL